MPFIGSDMNILRKVYHKVFQRMLPLLSRFFFSMPWWDSLVEQTYSRTGNRSQYSKKLTKFIQDIFWYGYWALPVGRRLDFQSRMMGGGDSAVEWAKEYQSEYDSFPPQNGERIGALDFYEAWPHVKYLEKKLSEEKTPVTVIQLGASSGREIAYFAQKYPLHHFVFTDIFDSVVQYAKETFHLKNLVFVACSAENLHLLTFNEQNKCVIFSNGSAQYVFPEHLGIMFSRLACNCNCEIDVIVLENGDCSGADPLTMKGSLPRGHFSYTHNYKYYAQKHNFASVVWKKIQPYPAAEFPYSFNTCHLFGVFSLRKGISEKESLS